MDLVKSFKDNIVESRLFAFACVLLAIAVRSLYYFTSTVHTVELHNEYGYFQNNLCRLLQVNELFSLAFGIVAMLIITFYVDRINTKYALIRCRSVLLYSFIPLLLSFHRELIYMNCLYIPLFGLLICIDIVFSAYQNKKSAPQAYKIGFILALCSLVSFYVLAYLVICLVGIAVMRSFSFKSLMASLLGVVTVYWMVFFVFLLRGDIDGFIEPFNHFIPPIDFDVLGDIDLFKIILGGLNLVFLIVVISMNKLNAFMDKIRIRENFMFLNILLFFSYLCYTLFVYNSFFYLLVLLVVSALIFTRFFSPDVQKYKVYFFVFFIFLYLSNVFYYFLN